VLASPLAMPLAFVKDKLDATSHCDWRGHDAATHLSWCWLLLAPIILMIKVVSLCVLRELLLCLLLLIKVSNEPTHNGTHQGSLEKSRLAPSIKCSINCIHRNNIHPKNT
jgi:hypothetical protein